MSSLLNDIRKTLQGEKRSEFIDQILKEKALFDALKEAGLTVAVEDPQQRGRLQPYGVLSKDVVEHVATIQGIEQITASLIRFGIPREPCWIDGSEITAPSANYNLVNYDVPTGKKANVFGWHISTPEVNSFRLWTNESGINPKRLEFAQAGVYDVVLAVPLMLGIGGEKTIRINNLNAGGAGKVYQASLLLDVY